MEKELTFLQMATHTMGSTKMENLVVRELMYGNQGVSMKENLEMD